MLYGRSAANGEVAARVRTGPQTEARLLARIAEGDLRAFEDLYRIYHPRLTRFLMNLLRRRHLAEEVLNDTMMVVWRRADRFNGASQVSTWIFAIAYRSALKALSRLDEPIEDKHAETHESPEAGPEQMVGLRQVQERLSAALAGLSPEHRAVVDLTYFHEMGYREIAEVLNCPVDTVKTRMFYARRRLKAVLPERLGDWL